jgi:hypothetical protein
LYLDLRIEARLTPPQSFGRPEVASRASIRISLNAQPGEWNGDSVDSSRFPSQRLSHPGGTRTTVASPVVVMRPLTVRPDQRIGVASSLNFPLKAMGLRARGQNHALMDPPARFAHYQTAKRLPDLRLPVMPHMFDITKLGSNSTRTNPTDLQCYGACHHGHPTRNICVRICETAAPTKAARNSSRPCPRCIRRKLPHGGSPRRVDVPLKPPCNSKPAATRVRS